MITQEEFFRNLSDLNDRIEDACEKSGRTKSSLTLLPVTKNWPSEVVKYCKNAGLKTVGENRVQEGIEKMSDVPDFDFELIGHLQSNKVNLATGNFARIQTVDSMKLLERIGAASEKKSTYQKILIQVNAGDDPAKFGITVDEAELLVERALEINSIRLNGLMTIAPFAEGDTKVASKCFAKLRILKDRLELKTGAELPELSMGMSGDLKEAIAEGATIVRVGSALFGKRVTR
jgi:pyridoxal phosphate enzyme (YggS family)